MPSASLEIVANSPFVPMIAAGVYPWIVPPSPTADSVVANPFLGLKHGQFNTTITWIGPVQTWPSETPTCMGGSRRHWLYGESAEYASFKHAWAICCFSSRSADIPRTYSCFTVFVDTLL